MNEEMRDEEEEEPIGLRFFLFIHPSSIRPHPLLRHASGEVALPVSQLEVQFA